VEPPAQPVQGAAHDDLCLSVCLHPLHHLHSPGQVGHQEQDAVGHLYAHFFQNVGYLLSIQPGSVSQTGRWFS
jgi:hypothetical protein